MILALNGIILKTESPKCKAITFSSEDISTSTDTPLERSEVKTDIREITESINSFRTKVSEFTDDLITVDNNPVLITKVTEEQTGANSDFETELLDLSDVTYSNSEDKKFHFASTLDNSKFSFGLTQTETTLSDDIYTIEKTENSYILKSSDINETSTHGNILLFAPAGTNIEFVESEDVNTGVSFKRLKNGTIQIIVSQLIEEEPVVSGGGDD